MIITSKITHRCYDSNYVLYITDVAQWAFYFSQGCDYELLDILYDDSRNQKRPLCFVFRKSKRMKELYEMWLKRRENKNEDKTAKEEDKND